MIKILLIILVLIFIFYFLYKKKKRDTVIKQNRPKSFFKIKKTRERLKLMFKVTTDKAEYFGYNTETIQGQDCVNIEIEEVKNGCKNIILENNIFEDSWDAMGGTAFYSLVIDAKNHLRDYISKMEEKILNEIDYF